MVQTHTYLLKHLHPYTYYTHIHRRTHTHSNIHIHIHIHIHTCFHTCTHTHMYIHVHTCMRHIIDTYTHIRTRTPHRTKPHTAGCYGCSTLPRASWLLLAIQPVLLQLCYLTKPSPIAAHQCCGHTPLTRIFLRTAGSRLCTWPGGKRSRLSHVHCSQQLCLQLLPAGGGQVLYSEW